MVLPEVAKHIIKESLSHQVERELRFVRPDLLFVTRSNLPYEDDTETA